MVDEKKCTISYANHPGLVMSDESPAEGCDAPFCV
jgi:hypothetical protein